MNHAHVPVQLRGPRLIGLLVERRLPTWAAALFFRRRMPLVPASAVYALLVLLGFVVPVPLLAWLDRPKGR